MPSAKVPTITGPDHLDMDGQHIPLVWRVSKRARRISVQLDIRQGCYQVTLPGKTHISDALAFLHSRQSWLLAGLKSLRPAKPFCHGAVISVAGQQYSLCHDPKAKRGVWCDDDTIYVSGDEKHFVRRVTDWLKAKAKTQMTERALQKATLIDAKVGRVTLRDTKSRWGSCSSSGNLSFSWRLIMAPDFVMDYLAAHEVAHLVHRNHGPRFWALVDELTDHRAKAQGWLKKEGSGLLRIGIEA